MSKNNVLLVEDSEDDIFFMTRAFKETDPNYNLIVVKNDVDASKILFSESNILFDLIIIDLNLPFKNGLEILSEIKNHPKTKLIPTIIMSTSNSPKEIEEAYKLHASCYISKPIDYQDFKDKVSLIKKFWLETVILSKNLFYNDV